MHVHVHLFAFSSPTVGEPVNIPAMRSSTVAQTGVSASQFNQFPTTRSESDISTDTIDSSGAFYQYVMQQIKKVIKTYNRQRTEVDIKKGVICQSVMQNLEKSDTRDILDE